MPFSTWLVVLACTMSVIYQNCQNQLAFLTIAKTPTNKRKPPDHLNTILIRYIFYYYIFSLRITET